MKKNAELKTKWTAEQIHAAKKIISWFKDNKDKIMAKNKNQVHFAPDNPETKA